MGFTASNNEGKGGEFLTSEPNVAIVGAGPVGGILGAHLAQSGHYVVLCDILKDHLGAIKENG